MARDIRNQFSSEDETSAGEARRGHEVNNTQKKADVRLLAGASLLSLLLAYICGGLLLLGQGWIPGLIVLAVGYGFVSLFVIAGRRKVQRADPSWTVVLTARKKRFSIGVALSATALVVMAIGTGHSVPISSDSAGVLVGWSVVLALLGYYFVVSSYEYRRVVNQP